MAEQVKLALKAIGLEEQGAAVGLGDGALQEGRDSGVEDSLRRSCRGFLWMRSRMRGVTRKRIGTKGERFSAQLMQVYRGGSMPTA